MTLHLCRYTIRFGSAKLQNFGVTHPEMNASLVMSQPFYLNETSGNRSSVKIYSAGDLSTNTFYSAIKYDTQGVLGIRTNQSQRHLVIEKATWQSSGPGDASAWIKFATPHGLQKTCEHFTFSDTVGTDAVATRSFQSATLTTDIDFVCPTSSSTFDNYYGPHSFSTVRTAQGLTVTRHLRSMPVQNPSNPNSQYATIRVKTSDSMDSGTSEIIAVKLVGSKGEVTFTLNGLQNDGGETSLMHEVQNYIGPLSGVQFQNSGMDNWIIAAQTITVSLGPYMSSVVDVSYNFSVSSDTEIVAAFDVISGTYTPGMVTIPVTNTIYNGHGPRVSCCRDSQILSINRVDVHQTKSKCMLEVTEVVSLFIVKVTGRPGCVLAQTDLWDQLANQEAISTGGRSHLYLGVEKAERDTPVTYHTKDTMFHGLPPGKYFDLVSSFISAVPVDVYDAHACLSVDPQAIRRGTSSSGLGQTGYAQVESVAIIETTATIETHHTGQCSRIAVVASVRPFRALVVRADSAQVQQMNNIGANFGSQLIPEGVWTHVLFQIATSPSFGDFPLAAIMIDGYIAGSNNLLFSESRVVARDQQAVGYSYDGLGVPLNASIDKVVVFDRPVVGTEMMLNADEFRPSVLRHRGAIASYGFDSVDENLNVVNEVDINATRAATSARIVCSRFSGPCTPGSLLSNESRFDPPQPTFMHAESGRFSVIQSAEDRLEFTQQPVSSTPSEPNFFTVGTEFNTSVRVIAVYQVRASVCLVVLLGISSTRSH